MKNTGIQGPWQKFRGQIRAWQAKSDDKQRVLENRTHEEFVEILQKRYGYTREKAIAELNQHYLDIRLE